MNLLSNKKLKVHYAGSEQFIFTASLQVAGVRYGLFTVFPCICESVGLKAVVMGRKALKCSFNELPLLISNQNKHTIMDSGIFALAYGQAKNKVSTNIIHKWYDSYIRFINDFVPSCVPIVEVDCQSVISPDAAWDFRRKLTKDVPLHEKINVWHFEDKKRGLDEIIDFSSYIGFSIPEYNRILKTNYRDFVKKLVIYTKKRKPNIKIHLLGCTSKEILTQLNELVDSVDSTGWISAGKYGGRNKIEKAIVSRECGYEEYDLCLKSLSRFYNVEKLSDGLKRDCCRRTLAALYWKKHYSEWCGSQE